MPEISFEDSTRLNHPVYIDVRAPIEFDEDHIPGAVNIPLFDNEERAQVGTIYRQISQHDAILRGLEIAGGKISDMVADISRYKGRDIVINCFRGGMRSETVVSLLGSLGIPAYKLAGGYKEYRRLVRESIESISLAPPVFVLQGLTGVGKTQLLHAFPQALDLEQMAGHRSSIFGGIGLTPRSQKMFEGLLLARSIQLSAARFCLVEGESKKIGNLHIPDRIMGYIHQSPQILITAPMETRIRIIREDYRDFEISEVLRIVRSLENRIGIRNVAALVDRFERNDLDEFVRILLEKYYDPLYVHSLEKMRFIAEIENDGTGQPVQKIRDAIERHIESG